MTNRRSFISDLSQPALVVNRLRNSAVVWSWIFNSFRLGVGLVLLPLVLRKLTEPDVGMYFVLLSLMAIVPLVDFGFGPTIGRFVSYAMAGAAEILPQGVAKPGNTNTPNFRLLWEMLFTAQALYRYLSLILLVILGAWGTYMVELRIEETASPLLTRIAWAVTLVSCLFDIYTNWWSIYLRSMNEVVAATRIAVFGICVRLVIAASLLLSGGGLLSLPLGSFIGSFVQRHFARRACYKLLAGHQPPTNADVRKNLQILWPNTWRLGVQFLSGYLTFNANMAICLHVLGLSANAQYGLSVQLLGFASGMAAVWTFVKWPLVGQYRARHDYEGLRQVLWARVWLQNLTFLLGAVALFFAVPPLLKFIGTTKTVLPPLWFAFLILNGFLEMQFQIWGTLISTANRLPYLWPSVATNVLSLTLSLTLIHFTDLGLGALVLGPLIAGSLFNYWYWPPYAARTIGTTFLRFMVQRPKTDPNAEPSGLAQSV